MEKLLLAYLSITILVDVFEDSFYLLLTVFSVLEESCDFIVSDHPRMINIEIVKGLLKVCFVEMIGI